MEIIIGLIVLGLVLITAEMLLPGGVLGLLGGAAFIASVVFSYQEYGVGVALLTFLGVIILVGLTMALEFKWLPKTKFGHAMFLKAASKGRSVIVQDEDSLIGRHGVTSTRMAPGGSVKVGTQYYDARCEEGFLEKGEAVEVVGHDEFRLIVRKLENPIVA